MRALLEILAQDNISMHTLVRDRDRRGNTEEENSPVCLVDNLPGAVFDSVMPIPTVARLLYYRAWDDGRA